MMERAACVAHAFSTSGRGLQLSFVLRKGLDTDSMYEPRAALLAAVVSPDGKER
jgi:hypothetical protein